MTSTSICLTHPKDSWNQRAQTIFCFPLSGRNADQKSWELKISNCLLPHPLDVEGDVGRDVGRVRRKKTTQRKLRRPPTNLRERIPRKTLKTLKLRPSPNPSRERGNQRIKRKIQRRKIHPERSQLLRQSQRRKPGSRQPPSVQLPHLRGKSAKEESAEACKDRRDPSQPAQGRAGWRWSSGNKGSCHLGWALGGQGQCFLKAQNQGDQGCV